MNLDDIETPIDAETFAEYLRSLDGNFRIKDVSTASVSVQFGTGNFSNLPMKAEAAGWVVGGVYFEDRTLVFESECSDQMTRGSEAFFGTWAEKNKSLVDSEESEE